jgi:hypothetical protein
LVVNKVRVSVLLSRCRSCEEGKFVVHGGRGQRVKDKRGHRKEKEGRHCCFMVAATSRPRSFSHAVDLPLPIITTCWNLVPVQRGQCTYTAIPTLAAVSVRSALRRHGHMRMFTGFFPQHHDDATHSAFSAPHRQLSPSYSDTGLYLYFLTVLPPNSGPAHVLWGSEINLRTRYRIETTEAYLRHLASKPEPAVPMQEGRCAQTLLASSYSSFYFYFHSVSILCYTRVPPSLPSFFLSPPSWISAESASDAM